MRQSHQQCGVNERPPRSFSQTATQQRQSVPVVFSVNILFYPPYWIVPHAPPQHISGPTSIGRRGSCGSDGAGYRVLQRFSANGEKTPCGEVNAVENDNAPFVDAFFTQTANWLGHDRLRESSRSNVLLLQANAMAVMEITPRYHFDELRSTQRVRCLSLHRYSSLI